MSRLTQAQQQEIADWFDHPVTQQYLEIIEKAIADCHDDKKNAFFPETPHVTQERLAWLHGAEWAFGQTIDMRENRSFGDE